MLLNPVFIWAVGQIGYSQPRSQFPVLAGLVFALNMTVPMAAWMRIRGMAWRDIGEMSGASIVGAMLPIGVGLLGIVPMSSAFHFQCHLACIAMFIPMFLRLDVYTGKSCHMGHHTQREHSDHAGHAGASTVEKSTTTNYPAAATSVEPTEVSFGITGMTCASCV